MVCSLDNATCCSDNKHCCPYGTSCSSDFKSCYNSMENSIPAALTMTMESKVEFVQ